MSEELYPDSTVESYNISETPASMEAGVSDVLYDSEEEQLDQEEGLLSSAEDSAEESGEDVLFELPDHTTKDEEPSGLRQMSLSQMGQSFSNLGHVREMCPRGEAGVQNNGCNSEDDFHAEDHTTAVDQRDLQDDDEGEYAATLGILDDLQSEQVCGNSQCQILRQNLRKSLSRTFSIDEALLLQRVPSPHLNKHDTRATASAGTLPVTTQSPLPTIVTPEQSHHEPPTTKKKKRRPSIQRRRTLEAKDERKLSCGTKPQVEHTSRQSHISVPQNVVRRQSLDVSELPYKSRGRSSSIPRRSSISSDTGSDFEVIRRSSLRSTSSDHEDVSAASSRSASPGIQRRHSSPLSRQPSPRPSLKAKRATELSQTKNTRNIGVSRPTSAMSMSDVETYARQELLYQRHMETASEELQTAEEDLEDEEVSAYLHNGVDIDVEKPSVPQTNLQSPAVRRALWQKVLWARAWQRSADRAAEMLDADLDIQVDNDLDVEDRHPVDAGTMEHVPQMEVLASSQETIKVSRKEGQQPDGSQRKPSSRARKRSTGKTGKSKSKGANQSIVTVTKPQLTQSIMSPPSYDTRPRSAQVYSSSDAPSKPSARVMLSAGIPGSSLLMRPRSRSNSMFEHSADRQSGINTRQNQSSMFRHREIYQNLSICNVVAADIFKDAEGVAEPSRSAVFARERVHSARFRGHSSGGRWQSALNTSQNPIHPARNSLSHIESHCESIIDIPEILSKPHSASAPIISHLSRPNSAIREGMSRDTASGLPSIAVPEDGSEMEVDFPQSTHRTATRTHSDPIVSPSSQHSHRYENLHVEVDNWHGSRPKSPRRKVTALVDPEWSSQHTLHNNTSPHPRHLRQLKQKYHSVDSYAPAGYDPPDHILHPLPSPGSHEDELLVQSPNKSPVLTEPTRPKSSSKRKSGHSRKPEKSGVATLSASDKSPEADSTIKQGSSITETASIPQTPKPHRIKPNDSKPKSKSKLRSKSAVARKKRRPSQVKSVTMVVPQIIVTLVNSDEEEEVHEILTSEDSVHYFNLGQTVRDKAEFEVATPKDVARSPQGHDLEQAGVDNESGLRAPVSEQEFLDAGDSDMEAYYPDGEEEELSAEENGWIITFNIIIINLLILVE